MLLDACLKAPDNWRRLPIKEVCERITSGGTPSRKKPEYYLNGTISWVKTKELKDGFIDDTEERITSEAVTESSAKLLSKNTILLAMYGATVGMLGVLSKEMACNQACCAMVMKKDFDRDYFFYQLLFHRKQLLSLATGAAQQNLSGQQIKEFILPFPSLKEQRIIGSYLRSIDCRIDSLHQTNSTLEAIPKALFKSWFVNFEPVLSNQEGKICKGIDTKSASLFPKNFVEIDSRKIPTGWSMKKIADICTLVTRGVTPKYSEDSGLFIINQKVNRGADLDFNLSKELDISIEIPKEKFAQKWDLLINCLGEGTLGRVHLYKDESYKYPVDQHMTICRTSPETSLLLYHYLSSTHGQIAIEGLKTGSTGMTMLNISKIRSFEILYPDAKVQKRYFDIVSPLFEKINANNYQIAELINIKNTLLPKLLNGNLDLKRVESVTEEVS
jgi:type I restriction enzyme S subunit